MEVGDEADWERGFSVAYADGLDIENGSGSGNGDGDERFEGMGGGKGTGTAKGEESFFRERKAREDY